MPNFFKKLTGSLKMPEEEEIFSDEGIKQDDAPQPKSEPEDYSLEEDFSPESPAIEEDPVQSNPEEEMDESGEKTEPEAMPEEEQAEESFPETETEESENDEEMGVEEEKTNPYTIAQLAQARTAAKKISPKKSSNSGAFGKLKSFRKEGETEDKMEPEGQLAIDVFETPTHIVIKSTIAGVKAEDLDVGIEDNVVNIRGSRHREEKTEEVDYFYQECYWGTFSRSVILPVEVDTDKAEASLSNGVLTLKIPKIIKEKEKKIRVVG